MEKQDDFTPFVKAQPHFIEELKQSIQRMEVVFNRAGWLRLLVAALGLLFLGLVVFKYQFTFLMVFLLCLVIYSVLTFYHLSVEKKLEIAKLSLNIRQMYLARVENCWQQFEDNGDEFVDSDHEYAADLDVFGPSSLYQYLCCAITLKGRKALAQLLLKPDKNREAIIKRQQAVEELAEKQDFCIQLQMEAKLGHGKKLALQAIPDSWGDFKPIFKNKGLRWVFRLLPVLAFTSLACVRMGLLSPFVPLFLFVLQFGLSSFLASVYPVFKEIFGFRKLLNNYKGIFQLVQQQQFQSQELLRLQEILCKGEHSALKGMGKLEFISRFIEIRYSGIFYIVLNTCFLWDFQCVFALENWKEQYGHLLEGWMETVGQLEAFVSLAVPRQIRKNNCIADIQEQGPCLEAQELYHPLIAPEEVVSNTVQLNHTIGIVTGSNMSGKTTMLRTVGVNLVLAYAGACVSATQCSCSIMELCTSMRNQDQLNAGISTFYAELLRIKGILNKVREEQPLVFLIDELFKGTNSNDRITGARAVVQALDKSWCIGLVSTHDFELCSLEEADKNRIRNYHFTEYYQGDTICFDYKMRTGRCQTTNARHLMRLAGIEIEG